MIRSRPLKLNNDVMNEIERGYETDKNGRSKKEKAWKAQIKKEDMIQKEIEIISENKGISKAEAEICYFEGKL